MNVILVGAEGVSDPLDSDHLLSDEDQEVGTPFVDHIGPEMERLTMLSSGKTKSTLDPIPLELEHNDQKDPVSNEDENIFYSPKKECIVDPAYAYNKHNESIFDEERLFPYPHPSDLIKFDDQNPELVNQATLKALVVQLTSPEVIDYNLVCDFFLTYRVFIDAERVMAMLITRLYWALHYINSTDDKNVTVGKLALLRTFVVLRHWIINYFVDDFDNNSTLCNYFVTNLNKITVESNLVKDSMLFEKKILGDLKIHWLNQIRDFWGFSFSVEDVHSNVLQYVIPLEIQTKKLSKSTTEMSIHTNPSFRRSAMLSLYDLKSHHKMIIFDDNQRPMDNPQYCINNLLLQHHSSSSSLNKKLKEFQDRNDPSPIISASPQFGSQYNSLFSTHPKKSFGTSAKNILKRKKHNHLNLNNSSLSLKKTTKIFESSMSLLKDSPSRLDATGFSTNGKIKVPTSKVESILPPTPVKKMDYVLNFPQSNTSQSVSAGSGTKTKAMVKPIKSTLDQEEFVRSRSLKKIMGGWKKSFTNHRASGGATTETQLLDMITGSPMGRSVSTTSMSESSILIALTTNRATSIHATTSDLLDGTRVDILSARLIDELEYLIRFYMTNSKRNTQLDEVDTSPLGSHPEMDEECKSLIGPNSPQLNQKEIFVDNDVQLNDLEEDTSELDIVHMSHLLTSEFEPEPNVSSPDKDDLKSPETLVDSKESSFQNPTSINWNDENELNLDNLAEYSHEAGANSGDVLRDISKVRSGIAKSETQYFDVSDAFNDPYHANESASFASSISSPSRYNAEVQDLGIAVSPEQHVRTISFNEMNLVANRMSIVSKNSSFKRDSMKSYLSYDSAFSSSSPVGKSDENKENEFGLRKKTGFHNLRAGASDHSELRVPRTSSSKALDIPFNVRASVGSALSKSSSLRRSVKFTCLALNELPFSNNFELSNQLSHISHSSLNAASIKKKSLAHLLHMSTRLSDIADSSIFSVSLKAMKQNKDSATSNSNVAIPGISSGVLKELAAIPDESFQMSDPVEFALYKLEGKHAQIYDVENHRFEEQMKHKVEYIQRLQDDSFFNENEEHADVVPKEADSDETNNSSAAELVFQAGAKAEDFNDSGEEEEEEEEESDTDEAINIDRFAPRTVEEEMQYEVTPQNETNQTQQETHQIDDTQDILNAINDANSRDISQNMWPNITQEVPPLSLKRPKSETPVLCSTPNASMSEESNRQDHNTNANSGKASPNTVLDSYHLSNSMFLTDNVLEANRHISFVLSYGSKALADHFTLIERDMLQEIDWKELIELKWNKELTPVNSWLEVIVNDSYYTGYRGVTLVIARFNLMVNWIISECLLTKFQSERIHLISRLIHVAQSCYTLQNYSTLMQIILALTSEKIQRMRDTWKLLPPGDILMLKNLEELASPIKNFLNIRLSINQIKPSKGCIPFVGLYLSDLIFNEERPTFVKTAIVPNFTGSTSGPDKETTGNTSSMVPPNMSSILANEVASTVSTIDSENENQKLINFSKYRTSVHIVKSLSQCIEWSNSYDIQVNPELLSKCLYIKSLDEDEMNYCLSHIEN